MINLNVLQVDEWLQFYNQEPWGKEIEDWRLATISAVVANFSGRAKRLLSAKDFLPPEKTKAAFVDRLKSRLDKLANGRNPK